MPERTVLELRDLPANHPSVAILVGYGTSTICRLSIDPTVLPAETMAWATGRSAFPCIFAK